MPSPEEDTDLPAEMPSFGSDLGLSVRDNSFFEAVVERFALHYAHIGGVKTALAAITGTTGCGWRDDEMPAYWAQLWDYAIAETEAGDNL